MKKVFVTGGTGFVGRHIVHLLREYGGCKVYVLTRQNLRNNNCDNICFLKGNMENAVFLEDALRAIKPDILVHLAWNVEKANYTEDEENLAWVGWSKDLVRIFLRYGGKSIVGSGTCFEYDLGMKTPLREDSLCKPSTLYGKCKLDAYFSIKELADKYSVRFAWGRVFFPYGKGEEPRKLFTNVITSLANGKEFYCKSPNNVIDYIHVEDVAGIFYSLIVGNYMGIVNVGSGQGYRLKDVLTLIGKKMGKEDLLVFNDNNVGINVVSDATNTRRLGYNFKYGLSEGIDIML